MWLLKLSEEVLEEGKYCSKFLLKGACTVRGCKDVHVFQRPADASLSKVQQDVVKEEGELVLPTLEALKIQIIQYRQGNLCSDSPEIMLKEKLDELTSLLLTEHSEFCHNLMSKVIQPNI